MTLLSLLWLGLLLVFVRCPCLRLPLWASTCVGPHDCHAFSRVGTAPSPWVPLLWTWFSGESSTVFLLLCLPSGCGHPLGSLVSFVTIDRQRRFPLEKVSPISEWCRCFPTSSVGLSWILVAGVRAFTWLVTVLASTHLLASSAAQPGDLGVLPYCACGGAHTACWA